MRMCVENNYKKVRNGYVRRTNLEKDAVVRTATDGVQSSAASV